MKKLYSAIAATGLALIVSGCTSNSLSIAEMEKLNEKQICNIEVNGIAKVLASAEKYNAVAKEQRVEFKRLGMTTTEYIAGAKKAIETNSKTVPLTKNKKPTKNSVSVSYAAQRACKFAVSALTLKAEGKKTWREAVPGDGFKY
ncbi:MAG: hypothetical protein WA945_01835 [Arcobacteraceae bacterium]